MYIVGNEITITWILPPSAAPLLEADYDMRIIPSDLNGTYSDATLLTFISNYEFFSGCATFAFTPSAIGRYRVFLTTGAADDYTILDEKNFWVFASAPVSVACTKALGAISRPGIVTETPIVTSSWANIERIDAMGYNGSDVVLVAGTPTGNGSNWKIYKTSPSLEEPTILIECNGTNLPGWYDNLGAWITEIEYSPQLNIWICAQHTGSSWWSDDDGTSWNQIPLAAGYSSFASDINTLFWDPGLELFFMASTDNRGLLSSATGKTWTQQSTLEAIGGTHPHLLHAPKRIKLAGTVWHFFPQWEEYLYKTGDAGGSTGWTKTPNNGVIGGVGGTWTLNNVASDGTRIAVTAFGNMNATTNPSSHPAGWGPDGNSNEGWLWSDLGMPDNSGNLDLFLHSSNFSRPWVIWNDTNGWYDASALPGFTRVTAEPWATMQAAFELDSNHKPVVGESTGTSQFHSENDENSVWGLEGWAVVMQSNSARTADYIVMQRPI